MALPLGAVHEFLGRQLRLIELIGGQDEATLLSNEGLRRRSAGGQGSCDVGEHLVRESARARSSPLARAGRGAESPFLEDGGLHPWLKAHQCLARIGYTGKQSAAQFFEGADCCGALLVSLFGYRTLRLSLAGLGVDEEPALLPTAIRRS